MRAHTPIGEALPDDFEQLHAQMLTELESEIGEDAVDDYLVLDLINMANYLLGALVDASGTGREQWLSGLRRDYVEQQLEGES